MNERNLRIGISLIMLLFLGFGNNVTDVYGDPSENQITITEVFPDRTEASSGNGVFFTIHITSSGNPVTGGSVTVHEATDSIYYVTSAVSNGIAVVEWLVQEGTPSGWRTFIANYSGTTGHDPSSGTTEVSINNAINPGVEETATFITPDLTQVNESDTVNFDIAVSVYGSGFPLFAGGYIALYDTTENIVLSRHDIVMTGTTTYVTVMTFDIPSWYLSGNHTIEAQYSGSHTVDHDASVGTCIIESLADNTVPEDPPEIVYNTTISLDNDIIEITYPNTEYINVYIDSDAGTPITDGSISYSVIGESISGTADIVQGVANFGIISEALNFGSYQLFLEYSGNASQAATNHTATVNVAKGVATLQTTLEAATINYGDTTHWTGYVTNSLGNSLPNIPIKFESSLTGFNWDDWGTVMTNSSGYASVEVIWLEENQVYYGQPGSYDIQISILDNDKVLIQDNTHSLEVTKNDVILTFDNVVTSYLETVLIDGTLTLANSNPIVDAEIDIWWNGTLTGIVQKIATVNTDATGYFFTEKLIDIPLGAYELEAIYDGDNYQYGASKIAILEVVDKPTKLEKIDISPSTLNLGDNVTVKVNVTDEDSISSVTAFIYYDIYNFTLPLDYTDNVYQTTIWCDTQFYLGRWTIDIIVIDNLAIETVFTNAGHFDILDNPSPQVTYTVNNSTIVEGESVQFEISASDTLGIKSVKIEIESTVYDITQNTSMPSRSLDLTGDLDRERSGCRQYTYTYSTGARENGVFYFVYQPSSVGTIPFIIYVEDNAGKFTILMDNLTVEAEAPELYVAGMSSLNGTAPLPFYLVMNAIDSSGISFIHLYANNHIFNVYYDDLTGRWNVAADFSAGTYILSVIAEDIHGIQATLDLGTLIVKPANFSVLYASADLYDGDSVELTIQGDLSLVGASVLITGIENGNMTLQLDNNASVTDRLTFTQAGIYNVQVTITDSLGTQLTKNLTFNVTNKPPVFESVHPDLSTITDFTSPFTLEVETIVTDSSGVYSVLLYDNDTGYPLDHGLKLWYITIKLYGGTHTLKLVATDIHGAQSEYILGTITLTEQITSTEDPKPPSNAKPSQTPENDPQMDGTVVILIITVSPIGIALLTNRRKKTQVSTETST